MSRYPLANDLEGNPIDLPPEAVAWRLRRGGGRRGRPRVLFDGDTGKQIEVPLTATVDDLAERGCPPGRYRLEPVNAQGQVLPGIVAATEVFEADPDEPEAPAFETAGATSLLERQMHLIEQQNATLFRAIDAMAGAFGTVQPAFPSAPSLPLPVAQIGGLAGFLSNLKPENVQAMGKVLGEVSKLAKGFGPAGDESEGGEA